MSLLPYLLRERFDIVHCVDPPLADVLQYLRQIGGCAPGCSLQRDAGCHQYYPRVAHVHHVGEFAFRQAVAKGIAESHMTLIPIGVHTDRFTNTASRSELRKKHNIAESTFVILAVSNLERIFKRVDYIIDEVSRLNGDVLLWIDGHPDDPSIPAFAAELLGDAGLRICRRARCLSCTRLPT